MPRHRAIEIGRAFLKKLFSSRGISALITLTPLVTFYVLIHPAWLSLTMTIIIGLQLAIAVICLSSELPKELIGVSIFWILLIGFWYFVGPLWLSIPSAIIFGILTTAMVYVFRKPSAPPTAPANESLDASKRTLLLEAWRQTIEVQMHFNDLELRIRNYALTLLLAAGGGAALSLKEQIYFQAPGTNTNVHISALVLSFGLLGWVGFYLMDRFWYHRLLYGAVKHGEFIEKRFGHELSFLRLTGTIGDESSIRFQGVRIRTPAKIDAFYALFALVQIGAIYVAYKAKQPPS